MSSITLLDPSRIEIKLGDYRLAPGSALTDLSLLPRVQDYRRQASARTYALDREKIQDKLPKADYLVSRKIDGEMTVLVWKDEQLLTVNPGGTVRMGLPWMEEAEKLLSKAGIKDALIAGELYQYRTDRRPRVHDVTSVARNPQSEKDLASLRFAVFDLLTVDGQPCEVYSETWQKLESIFGKGKNIHLVETETAGNVDDVEKLFRKWVEKEGEEGLVVRSDTVGTFKIKPRHTLDVLVIGFSESLGDREGLLHDLLLAVMRRDGSLQVLTHVGGGFSEDERRSMLSDLKDMVVESEYAEVSSDHVAYQMVKPEWVIEISCLDLISQTTRGGPVNRMVLEFTDDEYRIVRRMPLVTVISPQFVRRREDKSVHPQDVSVEQISDLVEVPLLDRDPRQMTLPKSQIFRREVYTKQLKGETMVRKFVAWKTNKENDSDEFPAYVLHYTDFSPSRKVPLSREVRVSSSQEQIESLYKEMIDGNIKKGWEMHSSLVNEITAEPAKPVEAPKPEVGEAPAGTAPPQEEAKPEEKPKRRTSRKKTESALEDKVAAAVTAEPPAQEAPEEKKKTTRRRSTKKKTEDPPADEATIVTESPQEEEKKTKRAPKKKVTKGDDAESAESKAPAARTKRAPRKKQATADEEPKKSTRKKK